RRRTAVLHDSGSDRRRRLALADVGRLVLAHLAEGLRHLVRSELALRDVQALAGRRERRFELLDAVLGADQLLGLAGQAPLRDAEQIVDLGAALVVCEL